jgi:acyl carrier protein
MTATEIEQLLIAAICEVENQSGRPKPDLTPDSRPLEELEEFDSLNGVEVTVDVLEKLGVDSVFNNVLVEDDKALTIAEAAKRLQTCKSAKK